MKKYHLKPVQQQKSASHRLRDREWHTYQLAHIFVVCCFLLRCYYCYIDNRPLVLTVACYFTTVLMTWHDLIYCTMVFSQDLKLKLTRYYGITEEVKCMNAWPFRAFVVVGSQICHSSWIIQFLLQLLGGGRGHCFERKHLFG